jgi:hypothetical protein
VYDSTNRELRRSGKLKKMIKEMSIMNKLSDYPILVVPQGDKFAISDGQHRFEAAKILGYEIFYKITDYPDTLEKIGIANSMQDKWTPTDYVHHYSKRGFKYYKMLDHYAKEWDLPMSAIIDIFTNQDRGQTIKSGKLTISPELEERSVKLHAHMLDFQKQFTYWSHRLFIRALKTIMKKQNYDPDKMKSQLKKNGFPLDRQAYSKAYIRMLENIYNWQNKKKEMFL